MWATRLLSANDPRSATGGKAAASRRPTFLLLAGALTLAGCQRGHEPDVVDIVTYRCGELEVSAVFRGGDQVQLDVAGQALTLPLAVSASGARYADGKGNQFWTKGLSDGLLTLAGEAKRSCTAPSAKGDASVSALIAGD